LNRCQKDGVLRFVVVLPHLQSRKRDSFLPKNRQAQSVSMRTNLPARHSHSFKCNFVRFRIFPPNRRNSEHSRADAEMDFEARDNLFLFGELSSKLSWSGAIQYAVYSKRWISSFTNELSLLSWDFSQRRLIV